MQNVNIKTIALVIGGIAATVLLLFGAWKVSSKPQEEVKADIKIEASDQTRGNKTSKVVLVEYSDFQCPACKAYEPVLKTILAKYSNQMLFVYRHFPLAAHKNAPRAAEAAEAAGKQGKFWEMHDLLFKNQDSWSKEANPTNTFIGFAKDLKLDEEKFKKDIDSTEVKNKVNASRASGNSYQVDATPTFFLNGTKLDSPRSLDEFEGIIKKEIESSKK